MLWWRKTIKDFVNRCWLAILPIFSFEHLLHSNRLRTALNNDCPGLLCSWTNVIIAMQRNKRRVPTSLRQKLGDSYQNLIICVVVRHPISTLNDALPLKTLKTIFGKRKDTFLSSFFFALFFYLQTCVLC